MDDKIWLSSPHMGGSEMNFVNQAFDTNWIAPLGPNVNGFEEELQKYTGSLHAAVLSSGTAALHLALLVLGIGNGDEVLCQSFTFSATINPVRYVGAIPIFIDSEPETWNMCPKLLVLAIKDRISKGKKPKAIIPVHLYGMPAKMDEIIQISQEYEIPIIEDAAEALGSALNGKKLGTFGNLSIISFNGNKIITTSGGGALLSDNEEYIIQSKYLATQARDPASHYQHSQIGYNYRMSNILAGIGRGQLLVIDERVKKRRQNFQVYYDSLNSYDAINFLHEPIGFFSNRWLTTIWLDKQALGQKSVNDLRIALEKENIESRPLWKPMHLQPIFSEFPAYLNQVSSSLFETGLCLPSGSNLSEKNLFKVINNIRKFLNKI